MAEEGRDRPPIAESRRRPVSRRRLLAASGRLLVSAGLAAAPAIQAAGAGARAWEDLAKRLTGPLLRPGDPGFRRAALPFSLQYASRSPAGIARCRNAVDVREAILWAREHGVPLVARSGGHSAAGYSTTTGLMIDVSLMNEVRFDQAAGVVRLGGGVRNLHLYRGLRSANAAVTHGDCPGVGAAGQTLGGGVGYNMRAHGLACDQLVESEVVTAAGRILTLSAAENAELFWACRGAGGGNFGIHTSLTMQTFPANPVTTFQVAWTTRAEAVLAALLAALEAAPQGLGAQLSLGAVTPGQAAAGRDVAVGAAGQLYGSLDDLHDILRPAYREAAPATQTIRRLRYWDAQDSLTFPANPGYRRHRSRFFSGPIGAAGVSEALRWLRQWPGSRAGASMDLIQMGGRVTTVRPDATAFVHRDSRWLMLIGISWSGDDAPGVVRRGYEWQNRLYDAMVPFAGGGAYQNFMDPELRDWARAYYGGNLARLRQIKARVDPSGVFTFPQAIPPGT